MKYKLRFILILMSVSLLVLSAGCKKFLDRPPLTTVDDENAWTTESNLRLYANKYYPNEFIGYGTAFSNSGGEAFLGFTFSDDVFIFGNQSNFTLAVPNSAIWGMSDIRSINIMIDRIQTRMKGILSETAYNHWLGVAKFLRAMQYSDLVTAYGDVPYYNHVPEDTNLDDLYKPRTPRNEVMDSVYNDFKFAFDNVRLNDGSQQINKYIVAAFITRHTLREATWQKYYYENQERANKFFQFTQDAADFIINSGNYDIVTDFRTLFTSNTLQGNKDVIMYRHYDPAVGITHAVATSNNLEESIGFGPTTDFIKSFICVDGNPYQNSDIPFATNFTLDSMIKTRDSRLEATFYDNPTSKNRASYWYVTKFIPRSIPTAVAAGGSAPPEFKSNKNETDYPVFRYAEVLLNWIEAKAEMGNISQTDIDISVNKIRNRPVAAVAEAMGVKKTAPLQLAALPLDPVKDPSVPALLWEIRRERRMEFAFEYSRFQDLKRWKKLNYMDNETRKDLLSGGWVNFPTETSDLKAANVGQIAVVNAAGSTIVYNGNNGAQMRGFYKSPNTNPRRPFLNQVNVNPYLSPVGRNEMDKYRSRGYELKQTEGWPQQ